MLGSHSCLINSFVRELDSVGSVGRRTVAAALLKFGERAGGRSRAILHLSEARRIDRPESAVVHAVVAPGDFNQDDAGVACQR
jgi:hypothetical protein